MLRPSPLAVLLAASALVALLPAPLRAQVVIPEDEEEVDGALYEDPDIQLLDMHLALHTGGDAAAGAFGTGSVVAGIAAFDEGNAVSGLTLTLWGAATIISSVTSVEQGFRNWNRVRPGLERATEAERRFFREHQAKRLRLSAINRAIGLAADGTSLGIGIALLISAQPTATRDLGEALVANGAFHLGVDIFRTVVDGEVAREWELRNEVADEGYFGARRARPRLRLAFAGGPIARPTDRGLDRGGWLSVQGRF